MMQETAAEAPSCGICAANLHQMSALHLTRCNLAQLLDVCHAVLPCCAPQFPADADEFWQRLQRLGPDEPLPEDMPQVRR